MSIYRFWLSARRSHIFQCLERLVPHGDGDREGDRDFLEERDREREWDRDRDCE